MSKFREQKGFTLIEIVMVIILLGILAAVAIPKFVDLSTDAHDAAIDGAFGAVNSALSIAIAKMKAVPTEASGLSGFDQNVYDNVTLSGNLAFANYAVGADVTFDIRSGAAGAGRTATVTYSVVSGSPNLTLGAKANF